MELISKTISLTKYTFTKKILFYWAAMIVVFALVDMFIYKRLFLSIVMVTMIPFSYFQNIYALSVSNWFNVSPGKRAVLLKGAGIVVDIAELLTVVAVLVLTILYANLTGAQPSGGSIVMMTLIMAATNLISAPLFRKFYLTYFIFFGVFFSSFFSLGLYLGMHAQVERSAYEYILNFPLTIPLLLICILVIVISMIVNHVLSYVLYRYPIDPKAFSSVLGQKKV